MIWGGRESTTPALTVYVGFKTGWMEAGLGCEEVEEEGGGAEALSAVVEAAAEE